MSNEGKKHFSSLRLFLTGFAMGSVDIIPGVSGGTMAFILGIYDELLDAIKAFNLKLLKTVCGFKFKEAFAAVPFRFLCCVAAGILLAIVTLAKLLSYMLEHQQVNTFSFFFGLVLASIFTVSSGMTWKTKDCISVILGTIVAYIVVGMVPMEMPHDPLTLFLSGFVAIMAMILPGISGSFILLVLGQYKYVLDAVNNRDILTLLFIALGAGCGLTLFSRFLSWLLNKYRSITVAALVGFMIGSLRKIWPWKVVSESSEEFNVLPDLASSEFIVAALLAVAGFIILNIVDYIAEKKNPLVKCVLRK